MRTDSQSARTASEGITLLPSRRAKCGRRIRKPVIGALCLAGVLAQPALAGAPFRTDDAGIVPAGHFEFLFFYTETLAGETHSGILPGLEVHYGARDSLELDLVVPYAFSIPAGSATQRGYADTQLGIKWQFAKETNSTPAVGFVPKFNVPTGDADRGLGNGGTQIFLPLWFQKNVGAFQTNWGGGYWKNNGPGNLDYWFFGWQAQYRLTDHWTLGGEVFYSSSQATGQPSSTGFTLGGFYIFDKHNQLLFSGGKGLQNAAQTNKVTTYLGYQYSY